MTDNNKMKDLGTDKRSGIKQSAADMIMTAIAVILFLTILNMVHPLYFMKGDNIMSYNCYFKYSFEAMISGRLPLYNFRQNLGYPFLAMGQTGSLDPFVFIGGLISRYILRSDSYILTVMVFIYLPLASVFMYSALKELNTGRIASVVCSLCWALNSFTIYYGRVWMIVIQVTCWLPLMFYLDLKLIRNRRWYYLLLAALARVFLFYAGHPQFFMFGVVFESLFVLFYILAGKGDVKEKLKVFGRYILSFVPMLFMVLPLLLPMWQVMRNSSDRSSALDLTTFLEKKYAGDEFITGALFPFFSTDGFEVMNNTEEIGGCLNHFGYIPLFASLAVFISYILNVAGKREKFRVSPVIAGCFAASLVAVLWSSSTLFNKLIYLIPVLNRFRWPFKAALFAVFYFVVTGAFCLGKLTSKERPVKIRYATGIVLTVITLINFGILYMVVPPKYQGIYVDGDLDVRPSYFDLFENERYVTVGFPAHVYDDETSRQAPGYVRELNYNMATYYGFENYSGYGGVLSSAGNDPANGNWTIMDFSGSICNPDVSFIDKMRSCGVRLYVVSQLAGFDQDPQGSFLSERTGDEVFAFLEENGMEEVYSEDSFRIYTDPYALPRVYHVNGDGSIVPFESSTDINTLHFSTDPSFEGGEVFAAYNYHNDLNAYVDGQKVSLSEVPSSGLMHIDIPQGQHDIDIVYKDDLFLICILIAAAGTAAFCIIESLFAKKREKEAGNP